MSILDLYERTVSVDLPDGSKCSVARMGVKRWRKLSQKLRDDALAVELKAIDAAYKSAPARTPEERAAAERVRQECRMNAERFRPSYYAMLDHANTAEGIDDVLPFAAIEAGTDAELAAALPDILNPDQIAEIMFLIVRSPLGPKIGGDLGLPANPTSAASSNPATGESVATPGSDPQTPTSTGATSAGDSAGSTPSTSTT